MSTADCVASYLNRGREVFSQVKVVKCGYSNEMKQILLKIFYILNLIAPRSVMKLCQGIYFIPLLIP